MTNLDPNKRQPDPFLKEGPRGPRWTWIALGLAAAIVIVLLVTMSTGTRQMARHPVTNSPPVTTGSSSTSPTPVMPTGRTTSGSIPATPTPATGDTPPPPANRN